MRVSELAKELGKTSKDVLDVLQKNNQNVASHSSNVNEAQIGMVKKALNAGASEQPKADGAAPKKKLAAVYRPQNSQQRPAQPKPAARPQAQNTSASAQQAAENAAPQQVRPAQNGENRQGSVGRDNNRQGGFNGNREGGFNRDNNRQGGDREFDIVNDGEIVDLTDEAHSVYNQIIRGDLEGVKIGDGTHKRLANVPFRITSKTTGESHIIVTDANGQFSTSSEWVSHKQNTNAGKSSEDGIWFGTSTPDDSKGALLYDSYTIEELRCDSNKGMTLIPAFDVVISRNKTVIDLGTLTDDYEPEISIHTTAADKVTGEKSIVAGKSVTIVDTVTLDGLKKGTKYQLKGWQMVKSENAQLLVDGKPVESDYSFTAKDSKMEVEISYTFNASALGGKDLVTFEELYDLSNPDEPVKVAEHKDIEDDGQTVKIEERVITVHTTATDKATGEKMIVAGKDVTILDTVTLDGLEKGTKYQLKGWEMVKSENAELLVNGERVENDLAFTATDTKMEVQIEFTFNTSKLAGKELVTFEELYDVTNPDEPTKVAEHKDIEDDGQTVTITERIITMHTTATDKATGKKTIEAGKNVTIVDTVTLDGLEKGVKYILKGWEMVKSENAELIVNGKRVENDLSFTATDTKMEVQIEFTFNASELAGKELVTFEELYDVTNPDEPIKVAEHKDIKDKGQTVTITEKPESPTTPDEPSTPTRTGTSPKTGDNTPFVALFAMMGISAADLIFAGYKRFRRVKKSK